MKIPEFVESLKKDLDQASKDPSFSWLRIFRDNGVSYLESEKEAKGMFTERVTDKLP